MGKLCSDKKKDFTHDFPHMKWIKHRYIPNCPYLSATNQISIL